MRICMLTSAPFPPREGIGFYIWNLSRYLAGAGHTVQIITRGRPGGNSRELLEGISIWRVRFAPLYPFHVHLHSWFVGRLLRLLEPEIDLVHAHTPLVRLPNVRVPSLVTVHSLIRTDMSALRIGDAYSLLMKLQAPVSCGLESDLLCRAGRVVTVSKGVAAELRGLDTRSRTVSILGNGVDTELFKPADVERWPARPYILAVGRLVPGKGWQELVSAARWVCERKPEYRLLIAGEGPLEAPLKRRINKDELASQVVLLGHISDRSDLVDLYRGAALFVHPALHEGLPTVLLEAMACGCPVVATAVSGALDVIESGWNGCLVPPRDPGKLAEAILDCLENPALCNRIGMAARQTIEARFSWAEVGRNYLAEYEQLLQERSR